MNLKRAATAFALIAGLTLSTPALAAPGLGDEVYGATVEKGEPEFEARYGRLGGGPDDGEDVIKLEAGYGVTNKLRVAVLGEFEREAGDRRRAEAMGIEAIYVLGKVGGVDVALYGEYEIGFNGNSDAVETKLLLQRRTGPWDLRLNLIAEKPLVSGARVELGYAASVDAAVLGETRLGVQAFGGLGTFSNFAPREEHFIGPVAKFEIGGLGPDEIGLQVGYLFALGKARDDAKGQLKVNLELEF